MKSQSMDWLFLEGGRDGAEEEKASVQHCSGNRMYFPLSVGFGSL